MNTTKQFVSLRDVDAEAAKNLPLGVDFQVSARTFTQIAAEKVGIPQEQVASSNLTLSRKQADSLRVLAVRAVKAQVG